MSNLSKQEAEILEYLAELHDQGRSPPYFLTAEVPYSRIALNSLVKKGFLEVRRTSTKSNIFRVWPTSLVDKTKIPTSSVQDYIEARSLTKSKTPLKVQANLEALEGSGFRISNQGLRFGNPTEEYTNFDLSPELTDYTTMYKFEAKAPSSKPLETEISKGYLPFPTTRTEILAGTHLIDTRNKDIITIASKLESSRDCTIFQQGIE